MYSDQVLDHFRHPRNVGELPAPAVTVEVQNPVCGDTLRLAAEYEGGRIAHVAYKVRGCTASVAAGSALTELLKGRTVEEAAQISAITIEHALAELPPASRHAAVLCVDAVKALLARLK